MSVDVVEWIMGRMERARRGTPFQRDPEWLSRWQPRVGRVLRLWFRPEVEGAERLPRGPMLLVSNHSGGLLTPEAYVLIEWWNRIHAARRPLYVLAHDILFAIPRFQRVLRRAGGIPASVDNAERALGAGGALLIFPGGDREAFRPWWQRDRVDFAGRRGFIRLALRTQTPIVPVVCHGSHDTTFVLSRGEKLAKLLGLDRLRAQILPIVLGLPWGIVPGFIPTLPMPARITARLLDPVQPGHAAEAAEDDAIVQGYYDRIVSEMQSALDEMVKARPWPLWQ